MDFIAKRRRPLIGVTGADKGSYFSWFCIRLQLWRCGARAKRLRPKRKAKLENLDGFVISGGADIAPTLYGETITQTLKKANKEVKRSLTKRIVILLSYLLRILFSRKNPRQWDEQRDALELSCLNWAVQRGLPVLGK